ncbi:hypothetical protein L0Z72_13315 [candidate division KSB1 bacterium]|nr:hypothetical protein [candidate division KSB1 bacterium]
MRALAAKQILDEIIHLLPENQLESIIDYASYLIDREENEILWRMQMTSQAYSEWLSVENDIYDEVFTSEI